MGQPISKLPHLYKKRFELHVNNYFSIASNSTSKINIENGLI